MESVTPGQREILSKVPAVTLTFWIIKIAATTLGETGGDTVTMTWLGETTSHANPYGYLIGTGDLSRSCLSRSWRFRSCKGSSIQ